MSSVLPFLETVGLVVELALGGGKLMTVCCVRCCSRLPGAVLRSGTFRSVVRRDEESCCRLQDASDCIKSLVQ